jgi:hypothetical protein
MACCSWADCLSPCYALGLLWIYIVWQLLHFVGCCMLFSTSIYSCTDAQACTAMHRNVLLRILPYICRHHCMRHDSRLTACMWFSIPYLLQLLFGRITPPSPVDSTWTTQPRTGSGALLRHCYVIIAVGVCRMCVGSLVAGYMWPDCQKSVGCPIGTWQYTG